MQVPFDSFPGKYGRLGTIERMRSRSQTTVFCFVGKNQYFSSSLSIFWKHYRIHLVHFWPLILKVTVW